MRTVGNSSRPTPGSGPWPQPHPRPRPPEAANPLTADELYRLTLYKWRYAFEAFGFGQDEVRHLLFIKWLHATRRVAP